jgi:acetyl-CoA carboxylase carboxyltransferase component
VTLALVERLDERLTPLERLEVLTDPGSLQPLRTQVRSRRMGARAQPGDGVLAAHARIDGRQVYCYAQDPSFAGGSLGEAHAETVVEVLRMAGRARVPVLGFVESAGARMQEGLAALNGYGRIFSEHVRLSGLIPQISIVCGPSAGGASYGPALNDFVIMSARAAMFLTGPAVVSESTPPCWRATCWIICPSTPASRRRRGPRWRRPIYHPTGPCPPRRARSMTSARSSPRWSTADG